MSYGLSADVSRAVAQRLGAECDGRDRRYRALGDQGAGISVAVFLAGVDSDLITGQALMVDGGMIRN